VKLTLSIDKHGPQHQASLNVKYEDDTGHGYRLLGPKYIGDSRLVTEAELSQRDANEVRAILDEVYPPTGTNLHLGDSLKSIRETLCIAQSAINHSTTNLRRRDADSDLIGRIIAEIDRQRPLGPDGKHGDRHTSTCGCEDGK
jgi:hypothetical protein